MVRFIYTEKKEEGKRERVVAGGEENAWKKESQDFKTGF